MLSRSMVFIPILVENQIISPLDENLTIKTSKFTWILEYKNSNQPNSTMVAYSIPRGHMLYLVNHRFSRIISRNHIIIENPRKITIFIENPRFLKSRSFSGDPPKIIKNRLNFALSEKFTYVRNPENWRKILIFLNISKKIKFFFAFFDNHRFSLIISKYGDFRTELSRIMVPASQIWSIKSKSTK